MHEVKNEFIKNVNMLIGKECWGHAAGNGTGSIVSVHFGRKILRKHISKNSHLSEDCKKYDGEFGLLIYSPWRICDSSGIISASYFDNTNDGPMIQGLNMLLDKQILSVVCEPPGFDLRVEFENSIVLDVFASDYGIEIDDFYIFFSPAGAFGIKPYGIIDFETE